jgi:hypothetical protein
VIATIIHRFHNEYPTGRRTFSVFTTPTCGESQPRECSVVDLKMWLGLGHLTLQELQTMADFKVTELDPEMDFDNLPY